MSDLLAATGASEPAPAPPTGLEKPLELVFDGEVWLSAPLGVILLVAALEFVLLGIALGWLLRGKYVRYAERRRNQGGSYFATKLDKALAGGLLKRDASASRDRDELREKPLFDHPLTDEEGERLRKMGNVALSRSN